MTVTSLHTGDRLYIGVNQTEEMMKQTIFADGKERKGLGMKEYGRLTGWFLSIIGISFKTTDSEGKGVYINKKSFCHLVVRLHHNLMKPELIQKEYEEGKITKEHERTYKLFNEVFKPGQNIIDLSHTILHTI